LAAVKRFILCAFVAGALFGIGLVLSSMTDPQRVIGFLDVFGAFDPTLAFVLGGAVFVTLLTFRFILRMRKPALAARFELPQSHAIDAKLITGAALFGVGWGLAGYCPGPAIAGLAIGSPEALWFVSSMVLGSAMHRWVHTRGQRGTRYRLYEID
jgi:uncharacterized membrane protein YedE/YeeE